MGSPFGKFAPKVNTFSLNDALYGAVNVPFSL